MDRLSQLMQIKMMEKAMQEVGPIINGKQKTGDFFDISCRVGANEYHISIDTKEDYEIVQQIMTVFWKKNFGSQ